MSIIWVGFLIAIGMALFSLSIPIICGIIFGMIYVIWAALKLLWVIFKLITGDKSSK